MAGLGCSLPSSRMERLECTLNRLVMAETPCVALLDLALGPLMLCPFVLDVARQLLAQKEARSVNATDPDEEPNFER